MAFWPKTDIPKSTGNAFDLSTAKPSGFATSHEQTKAKKHASTVINAYLTAPMPGLSQRAQKALMVPSRRIGIVLEGSADLSRVPAIPKAQRSSK